VSTEFFSTVKISWAEFLASTLPFPLEFAHTPERGGMDYIRDDRGSIVIYRGCRDDEDQAIVVFERFAGRDVSGILGALAEQYRCHFVSQYHDEVFPPIPFEDQPAWDQVCDAAEKARRP
jgi:hypothetical protein